MDSLDPNISLAFFSTALVYVVSLFLLSTYEDKLGDKKKWAEIFAIIVCLGTAVIVIMLGLVP